MGLMRLRELKGRVKRLEELIYDPKDDSQTMLSKVYEAKDINRKQKEDMEYLINRIERYEAALKEIMHKGKFIDTVEECCYIAEESLKDE